MATDAIDQFIALPQDQQIATLQALPSDRQTKLLAEVKERRTPLNTKLTRPMPPEFQKAHPLVSAASDFGGGAINAAEQVVTHPIQTAKGTIQAVGDIGNVAWPQAAAPGDAAASRERLKNQLDFFKAHPAYSVGGLVGGSVAGEGLGEVAGATARVVPAAFKRGVELTTQTGPRETAKLVEKTKAGNAAEVEKATTANINQGIKRQAELKKFHEAAKKASGEPETSLETGRERTPQELQSHKEALERGVEQLDPEIKTDLEATETRVRGEANRQYNELSKALKDEKTSYYQPKNEEGEVEGEPVSVPERLYETATESLRGSETEPAIIKGLGTRVQHGDTELTYDDLQGYREEIGRELRKGDLAPDIFSAYKKMMPQIDEAMQEMANRRGLGKAQLAARNYYRNYAQTFLDNSSPIRKALDSTERGGVMKALRGKDQSGIEALAKYNPELARKVNTVRGYAEEAKGIRKSSAAPKTAPKLSSKPPTVKPEIKNLGTEDIREAKTKGLREREETIRRRGEWIALGVAGYQLLRNAANLKFGEIPGNIAEGVVAVAGVAGVAKLLENPKLVRLLTEPTARDLAQIPLEMRSNLGPVIKAAQAKGIRVSPALLAAVGAGAATRPQHPTLSPASPIQ